MQEHVVTPNQSLTGTLTLPTTFEYLFLLAVMASPHVLDHAQNIYLTVTVAPSSPVSSNPQSLAIHPSMTYLGTVGALPDVQLISVPRESWEIIHENVMNTLKRMDGVRRVEMEQPPKMRAKRSVDEL